MTMFRICVDYDVYIPIQEYENNFGYLDEIDIKNYGLIITPQQLKTLKNLRYLLDEIYYKSKTDIQKNSKNFKKTNQCIK